jgi:GNAT superfamily N-acetyltransferase
MPGCPRSVARGLPSPVPDHGGFRVDTGSDAELVRWVFPAICPELEALARSIDKPRHLLKLCGTADELQSVLPRPWKLYAPGYFMRATATFAGRLPPEGYRIELERIRSVVRARIVSEAGALAAIGYAVEAHGVFIYDRIVTEPEHRRKGLAHALMTALHAARQQPDAPELLVATEEGRALYAALGWTTMSPYSTASIILP